ncbi:alpha/beta hydrolase [Candidatus Poriferisocius sp.]|uniref:alpha/beta hydrolase n=1 Tax=Candidatus Poriferisocius sp. TaxID=3101276 RepID=UPI003B023079
MKVSRQEKGIVSHYKREPYLIVHTEQSQRKDVYGAIGSNVVLQAQHLRGETQADTAIIGMHPIGAPGYLPMFSQLGRSGFDVVACATRFSTGDASLQMESVLADLGACVRDTRERLGYEKVVLAGWSGGGAVMAGYVAESTQRVITTTASGERTPLVDAELLPVDGLLLMATHRSRHHLLTGQLDASITDEQRPDVGRRPEFDLYDPDNAAQPPYSDGFLSEYREAQLERNRRITFWVKEQLAALVAEERFAEERSFVVHGTMADPRWLDVTVDPNDRKPNMTYMGEPGVVNNSPAGLGRFTSLRSWLSQWSYDDAQVDIVDAGPRIHIPTLLITAGADDACPVEHTAQIEAAIASSDFSSYTVAHADHYFAGPDGRAHLAEALGEIGSWMSDRGFRTREASA